MSLSGRAEIFFCCFVVVYCIGAGLSDNNNLMTEVA